MSQVLAVIKLPDSRHYSALNFADYGINKNLFRVAQADGRADSAIAVREPDANWELLECEVCSNQRMLQQGWT